MTVKKQKYACRRNYIVLPLCILSILLLIIDSESFTRYFYVGMMTSVKKIAPVLFPFMLTSGILINSGALNILTELLRPLFKKTRVNPSITGVCILGLVCGFPVGARCIKLLYDKGQITKKEADVMLLGTNCASPAFVICAIGAGIYHSMSFGFIVWCTATLTSFFLMFALLPKCPDKSITQYTEANETISTVISNSISKATYSTVNICAIITFFFMLTYYLKTRLMSLRVPNIIVGAICAILEISSGCVVCAEISDSYNMLLCAFAVGFGGLSVYLQVKAEAHENADMRYYLLGKTVCGLICSLFMFLVL